VDMLDENRATILAKQHGIKKAKDNDSIASCSWPSSPRRRGHVGPLRGRGSHSAYGSRGNASQVLRDAATAYKVDTDAIATKVKQEFAAKETAKTAKKATPKPSVKHSEDSQEVAAA